MKNLSRYKSIFALPLVLGASFLCLFAAGCGDGNAPITESKEVTDKRVENAKKLRELFDKVQGDYSKLTPEDKTAFDALTGSEAASKEAFTRMGGH